MTQEWEGTIPFANPSGAGKSPTSGWGKGVFDPKLMADNAGETRNVATAPWVLLQAATVDPTNNRASHVPMPRYGCDDMVAAIPLAALVRYSPSRPFVSAASESVGLRPVCAESDAGKRCRAVLLSL